MQNYFGPFYFGELKPYNSKYCSNFVLFWAFSWYSHPLNSRFCLAREIREIKGTLTVRVLQYKALYKSTLRYFIQVTKQRPKGGDVPWQGKYSITLAWYHRLSAIYHYTSKHLQVQWPRPTQRQMNTLPVSSKPVAHSVAYLRFCKGTRVEQWTGMFTPPHKNGMFRCTLEHCFKVNVPATDGLAPDVHALCLKIFL